MHFRLFPPLSSSQRLGWPIKKKRYIVAIAVHGSYAISCQLHLLLSMTGRQALPHCSGLLISQHLLWDVKSRNQKRVILDSETVNFINLDDATA
jgi:hypothetical protein